MGLRDDSARPQRVSGLAHIHNRRAESVRNPIALNVKFGDDSALSALTCTQWTAAFRTKGRLPLGEVWLRVGAIIAEFNISGYGVAR